MSESKVNMRGLKCPLPALKTRKLLTKMAAGEVLEIECTDPLTTIGGQQDEMVGECRWVVKALRQKAGILMAMDPKVAPLAAEVRNRTQKILRGGAAYEGARH